MKGLRAWFRRLAGLLPNDRRDRELADEIESHLQMHVDDNIRAGMTPEQARRDALLKLGGVEPTKEAWRERSTIPVLEHFLQDGRYAIRQLRQHAGFTATAILTLALGTGASVAIFAFVDAALLKPLPYRDPTRLVGVFETIAAVSAEQPLLSRLPRLEEDEHDPRARSRSSTRTGFRLSTDAGAGP